MSTAQAPEAYGAKVYGTATAAVGAGDDAAPIIAEILAEFPTVELRGFYSIRTPLVLPNRKEIVGRARYGSGLVINADVTGLSVHRASKVSNFRIRGTAAMTAASACLSVGEGGIDSARSYFRDLVVGGAGTFLGDATNFDIAGDAIRGGLCFSNTWENIYAFNARYGIDICKANGNANALVNASIFSGIEVQSCRVGARFGRLKGVEFRQFTAQGNTEHGLVLGFCQGVDLGAPYFEANHGNSQATIKADLLVQPSAVGEVDPGGGFEMGGGFFTKGAGSDYAIYLSRQRAVDLRAFSINAGYGMAAIRVDADAFNTGCIHDYFAPDGIINDNPDGMIVG